MGALDRISAYSDTPQAAGLDWREADPFARRRPAGQEGEQNERGELGRDQAFISPEARRMVERARQASGLEKGEQTGEDAGGQLSEEEQKEVRKLKDKDRRVRAHEQAHLSAAGGLARSGAKFEYQTGPDGQRYAVGGEVSIDTSAVEGDPQATLRKAERIRRAALAPADPSAQDRAVAAEAAAMAAEAQQDLGQNEE